MSEHQINAVSAAVHFKTAAEFWEAQAKVLRHHMDQERERADRLEAELKALKETQADPEPAAAPKKGKGSA